MGVRLFLVGSMCRGGGRGEAVLGLKSRWNLEAHRFTNRKENISYL